MKIWFLLSTLTKEKQRTHNQKWRRINRLLVLQIVPPAQDNRISYSHKSSRDRNVNAVEKGTRGKHTTRRKRAWHRAKQTEGKGQWRWSCFPLISSTPLITMTEGGQERENVSRETVKFGLMEGTRKGERVG